MYTNIFNPNNGPIINSTFNIKLSDLESIVNSYNQDIESNILSDKNNFDFTVEETLRNKEFALIVKAQDNSTNSGNKEVVALLLIRVIKNAFLLILA